MIINSVVTAAATSTLRQLAEAAGVEVAEIGQQQIEDITGFQHPHTEIFTGKEM